MRLAPSLGAAGAAQHYADRLNRGDARYRRASDATAALHPSRAFARAHSMPEALLKRQLLPPPAEEERELEGEGEDESEGEEGGGAQGEQSAPARARGRRGSVAKWTQLRAAQARALAPSSPATADGRASASASFSASISTSTSAGAGARRAQAEALQLRAALEDDAAHGVPLRAAPDAGRQARVCPMNCGDEPRTGSGGGAHRACGSRVRLGRGGGARRMQEWFDALVVQIDAALQAEDVEQMIARHRKDAHEVSIDSTSHTTAPSAS